MFSNYVHHCSHIPDGPANVETVLHGLEEAYKPEQHDFYDREGRSIHIPRKIQGKSSAPYFDDGYAKCLWDFRNDSLLLGDDEHTLYVRDVDQTGSNQLLDTWHAISSLETEYHIKATKAYTPWNHQMQVECAKLARRVRHGIKFNNLAFLRQDAKTVHINPDDRRFNMPYELTIDTEFNKQIASQATGFLIDVTADMHSAQNLGRMFATPLLEPYKHLTYVMYGDGGNGKGILLSTLVKSFPGLAVAVDSQKILGGRRGAGGFSSDQEMTKLIGSLWAYDEDADTITLEQMTLLKKISTGDTVVARRIQENAVSFTPKCTFVIATNNPVITTMTAASARRFVYIRMRDGRKPEEFEPLLEFRRQYGAAPFIMASCKLWENYGDEPFRDVTVGDSNDLSEAERWIVDQITANGFAISGNNPYPERAGDHRNSVNKLGLRSSLKKIEDTTCRVLIVKDEQRFAPYRQASEQAIQEAETTQSTIPQRPAPIEAEPLPLPSEFAFNCAYTPADEQKVARNWKKLSEDPGYDSRRRPDSSAYAVVPRLGMAIIDMDMPKNTDESDGWTVLNQEIGAYGSDSFPTTYLVGTPSGGVHAYYALPPQLMGKLKNRVHANGIPVDIRCENKGYVIGPGSHTVKGDYQLLDLPEGQTPLMPPAMVTWLENNGYVEGSDPQPSSTLVRPRNQPTLDSLLTQPVATRNGRPDLTPIPEGQRNTTLHDWAFGRRLNHPENETNIRLETFDRGRASGLSDAEITTIWNSILRQQGGTR